MNEPQDQVEKLKQHFQRRIHQQARHLVSHWASLHKALWSEAWFNELLQSANKLLKISGRYGSGDLHEAAQAVVAILKLTSGTKAPKTATLEQLNEQFSAIAELCSRADDGSPILNLSAGRKPIYLCFKNASLAESVEQQLAHFGIPSRVLNDEASLANALALTLPAAMVVDADFNDNAIETVTYLQSRLPNPMPVVFFSDHEPTIQTRLAVVRANGISFAVGELDVGQLVESMFNIYSMRSEPPFKVLIVDDSRSQATYAEKCLNSAGIFTRTINKPLEALNVLSEFQPDAILMDMYMPELDGPELAQILRQQSKFDAIPILYLSAESDIDKQLAAVSLGGDDFLTKPVPTEVLITTVTNRCRRHRGLRDQMIRDSLTGLLDHNNTLSVLENELSLAEHSENPVCFAMVDIDHFKAVNDTYGHGMGDKVIHALALYLRQRFRITDTIGRYGGEEFAIVLPDTDSQTAKTLLDEVRAGFELLIHQQEDQSVQVTFSCGIAQWSDGESMLSLAQRADVALYDAKNAGRNTVCVRSIDSND